MKKLFPLVLVFLLSLSGFSQQGKDTLTIPEKFDKIYRTSSSYQEYKVIRKTRFQDLKKQVSDSLRDLKKDIQTKESQISSQRDSINNIKSIAATFESDWRQTVSEKNSISILGIELLKSTYNIIVWSLILLLVVLLLYFMYRFNNSNSVTTKAKLDLHELEEEFAIHKKKALEREQKLRRQLQDEINKQRGV